MSALDYAKRKLASIAGEYGVHTTIKIVTFDDTRQLGEAGYGYPGHGQRESCVLLDKRLFTTELDRLAHVFFHELEHLRSGHVQPAPRGIERVQEGKPVDMAPGKWALVLNRYRQNERTADAWAVSQTSHWELVARAKGYAGFGEYVTTDPFDRLNGQLKAFLSIFERAKP